MTARRTSTGCWPTAATAVAGVMGSPIRHSLSPAIHNAAFAAAGLDWAFLAFDVAIGAAPAAIAGARALGVRGLAVTMPHKAAAAAAADILDPVASRLGAANTIVYRDGQVLAASTDGPGFLGALSELGVGVEGRRCVVLGAGGAARAVVLSLAGAGAARVSVVARSEARAEEAAALAGAAGSATSDPVTVRTADLVVNCTPLGMSPGDELPLAPDLLGEGQLVFDLVYEPRETAFLAAARARGADVCNGLAMLVHQAAGQFELWTGEPAPLRVMREAATSAGGQA